MINKTQIINFIKRYYRYLLVLIFIGVIFLYFLITFNDDLKINEETIVVNSPPILAKEEIKEEEPSINLVSVDVKGSVVKPGVYYLSNEMRVIDAINLAGGINSKADTSIINLSKKVFDEMVIIVYSKSEILALKEVNSKPIIITEPCICPDTVNDACINENSSEEKQEGSNILINLNTATIEELMDIPGIGETKAKEIISYRQINGNFQKKEDLMNVSGIGEATFAKIKDYFTL